jgi:hypothetical protein
LRHRGTSSRTTMPGGRQLGYEPLALRGMYRRAVEVYGIAMVARNSVIAFGWCRFGNITKRTGTIMR